MKAKDERPQPHAVFYCIRIFAKGQPGAKIKPPEARFAEGQAITPRPAGVDLEAMKTALMIAVNSDHSCQQYKQSDARKPKAKA